MDKFQKLGKIAQGGFGCVYKGKNKVTGQKVAMKEIRITESEGIPPTAIREISLLKEITHPNIVKLEDVHLTDTRIVLIFEFLSMDLRDYLDTFKYGKFMDPAEVKSYLYQINNAILYCHQRRILHRDLKPQNLLIDKSGIIKVADFGMSRAIEVPQRVYTHEVATLWFKAPEILLGTKRYSCAIDMWSIGCIFAEMVTKKVLFVGESEIDQLLLIFKTLCTPTEETWPGVTSLRGFQALSFPSYRTYKLHKHVPKLGENGLDLLKKMLIYSPANRITAKQAVKHIYFHDVKLPPALNSD